MPAFNHPKNTSLITTRAKLLGIDTSEIKIAFDSNALSYKVMKLKDHQTTIIKGEYAEDEKYNEIDRALKQLK